MIALLGLPMFVYGAVTVDSVSSKNTGANTSTTLPVSGDSWTHTISGTNTILIVGVAINQSNADESVSSITFNGKPFSAIGATTRNNKFQTELWYRLAPDAGTHNIVVTLNGAARFVAGAISFNGVDQGTSLGTYAGATSNNSDPHVTVSSEADALVVDVMGYGDSSTTATVGSGQTQRWTDVTTSGSSSSDAVGQGSTEAGASSVAMTWTLSSKEEWCISAVSVRPWLDSFHYRKLITIDRSKVGLTGTSNTTLSNYPVLISVTDNDLRTTGNGGHVESANGYDIIFRGVTDAVCGGTAYNPCTLRHQIVNYNQTTGTLSAWVRLPSINTNAAASDTSFYVYFGNSSITSSTQDITGVWDSNFQAVWHMNDNAANTTVVQSTQVGTPGNGFAAANTNTLTTTGKINQALSFNGTSDYIYQSNTISINAPQGYTLSAWIQTGTASGHKIMGFEDTRFGTGSTNYDRMLWVGTDGKAYAGCYSSTEYKAASNNAINDSGWHYLTAQINDTGNMLRIFVDGSLNNSTNTGGACSWYNGYWRIGSYKISAGWGTGSDGYYAGNIDEVRISDTIRSPDWIKTDFNNQNSPSTFYSVGNLETDPKTGVELISFTATNYSGLVQLQWKTGYEIENLGFRIYREDANGLTRITPSMVAGSALLTSKNIALTSGRTYIWQDFVESASKSFHYWLEDVDTNGRSTWYGPITTVTGNSELPQQVKSVVLSYLGKGASKVQSEKSSWSNWNSSTSRVQYPATPSMGNARESLYSDRVPRRMDASLNPDRLEALSVEPDPSFEASVKIRINTPGWYRLTQPQLVQAGLSILADPKKLQLYTDGVQQPIIVFTCGGLSRSEVGQDAARPERGANRIPRRECEKEFGENDWIEFYGAELDTPWTGTRAYWLVEGRTPGKRIAVVDGSNWESGLSSALTTIQYEPKTIYYAGLLNGDDENFFGSVVTSDGIEESLTLNHLDPLASENGNLQVRIQGVTNMDHEIQIQVNGTVVGSLLIQRQSAGTQSFDLPQGLLLPGENVIRLISLNGESDVNLLDYLRISYWRALDTDEDFLSFTVPGNQTVKVEGFTSPAIRVMDITNPTVPIEVTGTIVPEDGRYAITASVEGFGNRNLIAFIDTRTQIPVSMKPNNRSYWRRTSTGADIIILTHPDFKESVQSLKAQHRAEGFTVAIADVEDIYNEFNYGHKSPYALKNFLFKAYVDWAIKPRFLLLVGDASFDPKNYLGLGDFDYMPTKLIDTDSMETASDDWFVDFDNDGIPEIAVGRISVRTPNEAATQVAKIVAYKQATAGYPGSWADNVVMVADINDGLDFESVSDQLSDQIPGLLSVSKIYRGQMDDITARNQVLQSFNNGALLMNYLGHGSVELWRGNLLTSADSAGLTNGTMMPFVISMNCLNGFFSDIYTESLAEALMKAPNGGAIGVWAATSITNAQSQQAMNQRLFEQLFYYNQTIGEAIKKAKASSQNLDTRRTWIYFGDPTTRLPID